ncbi:hypothetical protein HK102_013647 [Quaeritorhiza haematococci]|nr:hypothetical protein HK102_013647 [Quaeritorhiza haematococci]
MLKSRAAATRPAAAPVQSEERERFSTPSSIASFDMSNDDYEDGDELDLDQLLLRAQRALEDRQKAIMALPKDDSHEEVFNKLKLDAGIQLPLSSSHHAQPIEGKERKKNMFINDFKVVGPYLNKDQKGVVRLDPGRIVVVDPSSSSSSSASSSTKPSKTSDKTGVVETLVVQKAQDVMPPELDYDPKKLPKAPETAGPKWFDMAAPEVTAEVKRDLLILKSRGVLDPKRHYKRENDKGALPKFFQIGTITEGPTEFYSSRVARKDRKQTLIDELMADAERKSYYKRKFLEIQETKQSGTRSWYKKKMQKRKPTWQQS